MNHSIINRYLMREIASIFFLGLVIFTLVLLMGRMIKLLEMVVSNGVPLLDIARLIAYLMPPFLVLTIPMSLLLSVLLTFGRMSADNEIVVLKSSGISLEGLLPPVMIAALIATAISLAISVVGMSWGNSGFKSFSLEIARSYATAAIEEHVFRDSIPGVVIYVDAHDKVNNRIHGVVIHDQRNSAQPLTIFAQEGSITANKNENNLSILLRNGTIHAVGKQQEYYRLVGFAEYIVSADTEKGKTAVFAERDMPTGALIKGMADPVVSADRRLKMASEFHVRIAFPFASLVFAVVAIPLGLQNRRSAKGGGFVTSIVIILTYYVLMSFLRTVAEKGNIPAYIALWLPNLLFFAAGLYLLRRTAQEKPVPSIQSIWKSWKQ